MVIAYCLLFIIPIISTLIPTILTKDWESTPKQRWTPLNEHHSFLANIYNVRKIGIKKIPTLKMHEER